jgi:hypothetical protein
LEVLGIVMGRGEKRPKEREISVEKFRSMQKILLEGK